MNSSQMMTLSQINAVHCKCDPSIEKPMLRHLAKNDFANHPEIIHSISAKNVLRQLQRCVNIVFAFLFFGFSGVVFAVDDREVDRAVVKALKSIAAAQRPNGSWEVPNGGESTAMTSLAVMAFLAAGHLPNDGPYGPVIDRGIAFVLAHQDKSGMLVSRPGHDPMYEHGISTLMLAEVVGMTSQAQADQTRQSLEKAVRLILVAQQVHKPAQDAGGWRYQPTSKDSDLSVTAWQLLALRAAKDIGCDVPIESIHSAVEYVRKCSDRRGFGYQPGQGSTLTMTASGILALEVCDHHDDAEVSRGLEFIKRQPLRIHDAWFHYGAYYTSIGAFKSGGENWDQVKNHLFDELLKNQEPEGGWKPRSNNEQRAGAVYATSLSVLALTVEYGYLPIYQR